jgi:sec-independent protein translocase protein TatA
MTLLFIGTTELLLIAGIALLLFGGKKLPELMKGLGKGMKSYKEGLNGSLDEEKPEKKADEEKA